MNKNANEIKNRLNQFTGTEHYYRVSPLSELVITDGVKYLCDHAGCYWLTDIIASYQPDCMKDEMLRDFQLWTLKVKDSKGEVIWERDTNNVAFTQKISHTYFPLSEITLYCENGVICLPSER